MPLGKLLFKLLDKLQYASHQDFTLFKVLRAHILPLTNCAFNKSGDRFITGSYDRTCKVRCTAPTLTTPLHSRVRRSAVFLPLSACVKSQLHTHAHAATSYDRPAAGKPAELTTRTNVFRLKK
jgi:WD40 repeat protein